MSDDCKEILAFLHEHWPKINKDPATLEQWFAHKRQIAETEATRDLHKDIPKLLSDIHDESLDDQSRSREMTVSRTLARFTSLLCVLSEQADVQTQRVIRLTRWLIGLTWVLGFLTVGLLAATLTLLPDVLASLELHLAAAALRFALGHEYHLPEELGVADDEREGFFLKLRNQPAAEEMPASPQLCNQQKVAWESRILGCHITVNAENRSPCLELAESLLAALEALLATGIEHRLFAHHAQLTINIRRSDFASFPFRFDFAESVGTPCVDIATADFHPHKMGRPSQHQLQDKLAELLVETIARFFVVEFSEERLKSFIGDELALQRAVNFTSSFVSLGNVLGYTPKTTLDSWIEEGHTDYPLQRSEAWDANKADVSSTTRRPVAAEAPAKADDDSWQAGTRHTRWRQCP